jgi:hypothetical protein
MRSLCGLGLAALLLLSAGEARAQESAAPDGEWTPSEDEQRPAHHARSFLEMGVGLALGTSGYWLLMNRNVADWDNPRPEQRFDGSAWVLDNNSLWVNYVGHPLTGGLSYSYARANHYSVAASFGYSFLTSFLWEFVLEFKEKVSTNDVIVTPGAGLPIGEFVHKLGMYLDSGDGSSSAVDALRWTLGSGVALDRKLDERRRPRVRYRDNLGFTRRIWHEFTANYGATVVSTPGRDDLVRYHLGISARLVTLPRYLRATSFARPFYRAEICDFSLVTEASRFGPGLQLRGDTIVAGYHAQSMQREGSAVQGAAVTLGSSVGYEYFRSATNRYQSVEEAFAQPEPKLKYHVPSRREQWAAFNLPGMAADFRAAFSGGALVVSGRAAPSFGSLSAPAFYDWSAANLTEKSKHILHRQGYFYGWGLATSLDARLALGPLRAGFELRYATYAAQDGWDRHPEQLTVDVPVQGDVLLYKGWLGLAPSAAPVTLSLELGQRRFRSQAGGFERTAQAIERGIGARWTF